VATFERVLRGHLVLKLGPSRTAWPAGWLDKRFVHRQRRDRRGHGADRFAAPHREAWLPTEPGAAGCRGWYWWSRPGAWPEFLPARFRRRAVWGPCLTRVRWRRR